MKETKPSNPVPPVEPAHPPEAMVGAPRPKTMAAPVTQAPPGSAGPAEEVPGAPTPLQAADTAVTRRAANAAAAERVRERRKDGMPWFVKLLLALLGLAVGIFIVLFVAAKVAGFTSINDLLAHLGAQLEIVVERLFS